MTTIDPSFGSAVTLYDGGQKEQAAQICHSILAADARHLDSLRMLGVIARDAQRYDESLEWLERALGHAAEDPILWFEHGTTLYQQGQLDRAAQDYQRALRESPIFTNPL